MFGSPNDPDKRFAAAKKGEDDYEVKQCGICECVSLLSVIFSPPSQPEDEPLLEIGRQKAPSIDISDLVKDQRIRAKVNESESYHYVWIQDDSICTAQRAEQFNKPPTVIKLSNIGHVLRSSENATPAILALYVKDSNGDTAVVNLEFEYASEMESICRVVKRRLDDISYFQLFLHQDNENAETLK